MTTISKKDTYKSFFDIAVPATLESLFLVVISMVDTQMISGLGTEAVSAISLTTQPKLFCFSIFFALAISSTILISQAYGRNAKKEANECFATIVRITIVFAIIMSVLTVALAGPIMSICNGQPDTMNMSVTYFRIIMGGMIFQVVLFVFNAALRGLGNSKMTFASNVVSGIVNIFFNYLLIEGHFGCPALGVAGAAIATVIGTAFACAASALCLLKKDSFINISYCIKHRLKANADSLKKIRHNTLTYFSESIFTRVGFLLSSIILAQLGSFDNSVYSVGMILMNVSFAFADGIQASILTLVGKAQGNGEKKQVSQYVKAGIKIGVIVSIVLAILFIAFSGPFYSAFSTNEDFVSEGFYVCCFVSAIAPFQIVRAIRISAMRALGNMKAPMYIAIVCITFLNPGVAFLLTVYLQLGLLGIWTASFITQFTWFILGSIGYRQTFNKYLAAGSDKSPSTT